MWKRIRSLSEEDQEPERNMGVSVENIIRHATTRVEMVPPAVFYNNSDAMHSYRQPNALMSVVLSSNHHTRRQPSPQATRPRPTLCLVGASSSLACFLYPGRQRNFRNPKGVETYQLVQVPVADLHVAAMLVQALCELLGDARAVVGGAPPALLLALRRDAVLLRWLGRRRAGAAAEEAADGVADRGADCDTARRGR